MTPTHIPGFTRHRGKWRIQSLYDDEAALEVAAAAEAQGVPAAALVRDRVVQGGTLARPPEVLPVLAFTTTDGRRVAVYEWPVSPAKDDPDGP